MADHKSENANNIQRGIEVDASSTVSTRVPLTPRIPVTEKVIFCVDNMCFGFDGMDMTIINLLNTFMILKKKLSVNDVEFSGLHLLNENQSLFFNISEKKDLHAFRGANPAFHASGEQFDFSDMFRKLAQHVTLPDPSFYGDAIPPPFVYHVILLFGQNLVTPTMKETNPFDFVTSNPYFTLDVFYLYDVVESNLTQNICKVLAALSEHGRGYFVLSKRTDAPRHMTVMAKLLGHSLMRYPQKQANLNVFELCAAIPPLND